MNIEWVKSSFLANEISLRFDTEYICRDLTASAGDYYTFPDLYSIVSDDNVNVENLSEIRYVEIGNITNQEDVYPVFIDFNDRNELNEKYFRKIEKGDIIEVRNNDILISKVRPYLKKFLLIDDSNNSYFYTSAFIHIRPKANPKVFFYALKNIFNNSLNSLSRQGKGYPTLNEKDLCYMKFDKGAVDILISKSEKLQKEIEVIEKKIKELKKKISLDEEIINLIIIREFDLDIDELMRLDNLKFLSLDFQELPEGSMELRNSVRFMKMRLIQQEMIRHFEKFAFLEDFLIKPYTKNGWSPENNEIDGATKILGIDSIHFNGNLMVDNPKYTNEYRDDIDSFYVQNNDFFVSRGNTVDLVALASIAENIDDVYIYPDIMIKLYVDETKINKKYLAYVFNSIIGRLYFKYASRGKQQTMVKVSSDTICNFIIPQIDLNKQNAIVQEIKNSIDAQKEIVDQIKSLRNEIDLIMEDFLSHRRDWHPYEESK